MQKQREEKERKERELQRIRDEVFKAIGATHIKPLASRPPLVFQESNEIFKEG